MLAANSNFLVPDGTFIAELIAFLVILAIIAKWILPPLNKAMQARQEEIRSSLEAAEEAKTEAEETRAQRQGIIEEARQQAREIVAQANRAADQVRAEGQERGQQEYDRMVASAAAEIALARQRALDEITSTGRCARALGRPSGDRARDRRAAPQGAHRRSRRGTARRSLAGGVAPA